MNDQQVDRGQLFYLLLTFQSPYSTLCVTMVTTSSCTQYLHLYKFACKSTSLTVYAKKMDLRAIKSFSHFQFTPHL